MFAFVTFTGINKIMGEVKIMEICMKMWAGIYKEISSGHMDVVRYLVLLMVTMAAAADDYKRYKISNRIIIGGLILSAMVCIAEMYMMHVVSKNGVDITYGGYKSYKDIGLMYLSGMVWALVVSYVLYKVRAIGADTRLPDGSRVNMVLPPIAIDGPIITIRKFYRTPMDIERMIQAGSITVEAADFLKLLVKAKYNIFVSGGTGSGKTTFLNALSNYIPKDERILTIEDSAELQISGVDNLVRLEVRRANMEGDNEVTIRDLIKSSLRMRPDRVIVGEVRGEEALDMLQAIICTI